VVGEEVAVAHVLQKSVCGQVGARTLGGSLSSMRAERATIWVSWGEN
jgi:hypothetical protein